MREMQLMGSFGLFLFICILVAGCTTTDQAVGVPFPTRNLSQDSYPLPTPALSLISTIPFSSLPDATIETIPGVVVNFSNSHTLLQIKAHNESPITHPPVDERPLFTTFHVGESANDGNTRITLNSVMYNQSFRLEPYNQYGEFRTQRPDYQLMLLSITIRDLGTGKAGSESPFNGIVIKDSTGQRYTPGLSIISDVAAGDHDRTGYLFYEVPHPETPTTLEYHFPGAIGVVSKFNLTS